MTQAVEISEIIHKLKIDRKAKIYPTICQPPEGKIGLLTSIEINMM